MSFAFDGNTIKLNEKDAQENRTDMAGRKLTREGHVQFKTHP